MGASKAEGTRGMTRLHVPQAWRETAATILRDRPRVILVLGGGDAGKSSFCRFLLAELLAAGHRVAVVDSDLGQKDIGPPATVTVDVSRVRRRPLNPPFVQISNGRLVGTNGRRFLVKGLIVRPVIAPFYMEREPLEVFGDPALAAVRARGRSARPVRRRTQPLPPPRAAGSPRAPRRSSLRRSSPG